MLELHSSFRCDRQTCLKYHSIHVGGDNGTSDSGGFIIFHNNSQHMHSISPTFSSLPVKYQTTCYCKQMKFAEERFSVLDLCKRHHHQMPVSERCLNHRSSGGDCTYSKRAVFWFRRSPSHNCSWTFSLPAVVRQKGDLCVILQRTFTRVTATVPQSLGTGAAASAGRTFRARPDTIYPLRTIKPSLPWYSSEAALPVSSSAKALPTKSAFSYQFPGWGNWYPSAHKYRVLPQPVVHLLMLKGSSITESSPRSLL